MSCVNVTLYCAWCQRVVVGSSHCCDPFDHGELCHACAKQIATLCQEAGRPIPAQVEWALHQPHRK